MTLLAESSPFTGPARNDLLPPLQLVKLSPDDLRPSSRKLRKRELTHVQEIARSTCAFGFCLPILIGKGNVIIDGEIRFEAANLLGLAETPCIRIDHLSDADQRLLRLAVNRLGEKGEWDLDELKIEFEELLVLEPGRRK